MKEIKSYTIVFFDGVDSFTRTEMWKSEKEIKQYYKNYDCEVVKIQENFVYDSYNLMCDTLCDKLLKENNYGKLEIEFIRRVLSEYANK